MFCASTNRSIDVIAGKLIPGTYLIDNFKALIAQQNLRLALWNSFRNATVLTFLCLLVCSIAGYGFEIYHDKAKDAVFTVLLTAMMIPFAAIRHSGIDGRLSFPLENAGMERSSPHVYG